MFAYVDNELYFEVGIQINKECLYHITKTKESSQLNHGLLVGGSIGESYLNRNKLLTPENIKGQ